MCGIAGSFGRRLVAASAEPGPELRAVLRHRGPDGFGCWQDDEEVSLLHWRLAVIDLSSAGHQPMSSSDGRFVLSYNGEVYNHPQLRREVEQAWSGAREGDPAASAERRWRGHSDTEVIAEGCALWGVEFLQRLNGMFALALFDRVERRLHLARDRAGIKPLYVYPREHALLFASEAKFFFQVPEFEPRVDPAGLSAYFTYGHAYDARHVLAGVRQLEPGEVLTCSRGEGLGAPLVLGSSRLCARPRWRPIRRGDDAAAAQLKQTLAGVVERQLVADVPVGVLLSGGVDSSILTALAARVLGPDKTETFTLGYRGMGPDYDELDHARRVASHLGVRHHVYEARPDDLIQDLERLVWHYDEPFADAAALNVFVLSRKIRSHVTVALAGEGADELFGGYRRYQLEQTIRAMGWLGRALGGVVRAAGLERLGQLPRRAQILLRVLSQPDDASRYSSYLQSGVPLETLLQPEWVRRVEVHERIREDYRADLRGGTVSRLCLVDQQFWLPSTYLEKSDKGAMAHSLELRVPYLDNEVVDFANTLPDEQRIRNGSRKWLLRKAFGDLLPPEVFRRFKRGFGVPVGRWLRHELREYYLDQVLSPGARVLRYVQPRTLEACFRDHVEGSRDCSLVLWECLVLEIWLRHLERGFRREAASTATSERAIA